jgi:hypothetical protein
MPRTGPRPNLIVATLGRYAGRLQPGAVEHLAERWRVELMGLSSEYLDREIPRRLSLPENRGYLLPRPARERIGPDAAGRDPAKSIAAMLNRITREMGDDHRT